MTATGEARSDEGGGDAYLHWREECAAVWNAYARWAHGSGRDAMLAFAAYRDALEREERAAARYRQLSRRAASTATRTGMGVTDPDRGLLSCMRGEHGITWYASAWVGGVVLPALLIVATLVVALGER